MKSTFIAITGIVFFLAIAAGAGFYIHTLISEREEARARIEILEASQKLSQEAESRAIAARQVENEKSKERERLMQNVLDEHCDWSDIELPDDVVWMFQHGKTGSGFCPSSDTSR